MKGTIKYYTPQKGFGFIKGDASPQFVSHGAHDYFFHMKEVLDRAPEDWPKKGERVEFEAGTGDKGPIAKRVRFLDAKQISGPHVLLS